MIISDRKKFIFLHNPKCAGTSIRNKLMQYDDRNNYYWLFSELFGYKFDKAHMSLSTFYKFNKDDFSLMKDYFTFGFVRNPYTRIVSAFSESHPEVYKKYKNGDVETYKLLLNKFIDELTIKKTCGYNLKYRHAIQQNRIFYFGNKLHSDLIIKLENIDEDIEKLKYLHHDVYILLKETNKQKNNVKSIKDNIESLLTRESINTINKVYEEDFKLFDYKMVLND